MPQAERASSLGDAFYILRLVLIYFVAFSMPLLVAGKLSGLFSVSAKDPDDSDPFFPQAFTVSGPRMTLRVGHIDELNPSLDRDFLLIGWFKVRAMPRSGDRTVLLSKFDKKTRFRRGYALALLRDGEHLRPSVYWADNQGHGGWYNFSDFEVNQRSWFMLAVSFYGGKFLGLHGATGLEENDKAQLKLLGGYELDPPHLPFNRADLLLGADEGSSFRGKVGPFGVFRMASLSEKLKPVLKQVIRDRLSVPASLEQDDIVLWSNDGKSDSGPRKLVLNSMLDTKPGAADTSAGQDAESIEDDQK